MATSAHRRRLSAIGTVCGFAALWAVPAACLAAATTQPGSAAATQPSAALLQRVNQAYANIKFAQFDGHLAGHFDVAGQQKNQDISFTSAYAAPNRFRHDAKGDIFLDSTGEKVFAYQADRNTYTQSDAPSNHAAASDWPSAITGVLLNQNPSLLLALTSSTQSDQTQGLADLASDMTRPADITIGSTAYPAMQFQTPDHVNVTMLFDPQSYLLRQVRFDEKPSIAAQGATDVKAADVTIDYTRAEVGGAGADADASKDQLAQFAWTPPANATLATAASPAAPAAGEPGAAASAMVGKTAPDFSLAELNDKKIKLAGLRGSVVVLDFWATWCGPCVESLPHLDDLYKEQSSHGAKIFAVNEQEEKEAVSGFVQKKGWSLPVLLDSDGAVGQAYGADAIPETVVIGKDGKVQNVFVGSGNEDNIKSAVAKASGQ